MALSESLGIIQQKFIFLLFCALFGNPMILYTSIKSNFCLDTNLNAESAYFVKFYTRGSQCMWIHILWHSNKLSFPKQYKAKPVKASFLTNHEIWWLNNTVVISCVSSLSIWRRTQFFYSFFSVNHHSSFEIIIYNQETPWWMGIERLYKKVQIPGYTQEKEGQTKPCQKSCARFCTACELKHYTSSSVSCNPSL